MASCMPALHGSLDAQQLLAAINAPSVGGFAALSSPSTPPSSGCVSLCPSPSSQPAQYIEQGQPSPSPSPTGAVLGQWMPGSTSGFLGQLSPTQHQQLMLEFKQLAQGMSQAGPSSKTSRMLQEVTSSAGDAPVDLQLPSSSSLQLQAQLGSPLGNLSQQPQQQQQQLALPAGGLAVSEASTVCTVHGDALAAPTGIVSITESELEHLMLLRSMKRALPATRTTEAAAASDIAPTQYLDQQQRLQQQQQQQHQLYVCMENSTSSIASSGTCFSRSYSSGLSPTNASELPDSSAFSLVTLSEALGSVPQIAQQLQLQEQQLQQQLHYQQQLQQQLMFAAPVPEDSIYGVPPQAASAVARQDLTSLLNPLYSTPSCAAGAAAAGGLFSTGATGIPSSSTLMSNLIGQPHTMLPTAAAAAAGGGGMASGAGGLPIANYNAAATTAAAAAAAAAGVGPWPLVAPGSTCRLFIGNLGWWVDEQLLLEYFGKCGQVVDIQVMWNTKMYSRGRKVNREFAFISYNTPQEAQHAVQCLHGLQIPDLQKDLSGITVEYENGSILKGRKMKH